MNAAIELHGVSKRFVLYHERARSLQDLAISILKGKGNGSRETFWALRDVSFTVQPGETLGIIGPNGSGKSTILKLISRIIEPTSGAIRVHGKVSGLLELGAGFHPDLTGRENVYLNGSILGMGRKEIDRKLAAIIEFSELERFIDTPLKHYSSGMQLRLGFAVAIHTDPQVLLIDEVLAVGDQAFQNKCLDRVRQLQENGTTIVFVSHGLEEVRNLCSKVLWLDAGEVMAQGEPDRVIDGYLESVARGETARQAQRGSKPGETNRWGTGEVEITGVRFLNGNGDETHVVETGRPLVVRIGYVAHQRVVHPVFGLAIHRSDGLHISGPNTRASGFTIDWVEGPGEVEYSVEALPLFDGTYRVSVAVYDHECSHPFDHHHQLYPIIVRRGQVQEGDGIVYAPSKWRHLR